MQPGLAVPDEALTWRFSRASGPGGQHVNTTDTRVELVVDLALALPAELYDRAVRRLGKPVLTVVAADSRSQLQNRKAALERAAQALREAVAPPPPPRRPTRPTRGSVQRRLDVKRRRSDVKRGRQRPPEG